MNATNFPVLLRRTGFFHNFSQFLKQKSWGWVMEGFAWHFQAWCLTFLPLRHHACRCAVMHTVRDSSTSRPLLRMPCVTAAPLIRCRAHRARWCQGMQHTSLVRRDMRHMPRRCCACCARRCRVPSAHPWCAPTCTACVTAPRQGVHVPTHQGCAPHASALSRMPCTTGAHVHWHACHVRQRRVPGAHPWCAGTCAACLGAVAHATHDGGG